MITKRIAPPFSVILVFASALVLIGLAQPPPVLADVDEFMVQITIPIAFTTSNDCAAEDVAVSGDLHIVFLLLTDGSGGFHMEQHDNFERATAVGLTSGRPYRVVEADRVDTNTSGPPPLEATFEETLNLIGQGAADNQQVSRPCPHHRERQRRADGRSVQLHNSLCRLDSDEDHRSMSCG